MQSSMLHCALTLTPVPAVPLPGPIHHLLLGVQIPEAGVKHMDHPSTMLCSSTAGHLDPCKDLLAFEMCFVSEP